MFVLVKGKFYFDEEILKAFPVLAKKENRLTVEFVFFALYYGSPFARFPENERWQLARKKIFGKKDVVKEELPDFTEIRETISGLQYDEKRETLRSYTQKIANLNQRLIDESDPKKIAELDVAIERLSKRVRDMNEQIAKEDESLVIRGGGSLTYLEKWQDSMVEFEKKKQEAVRRQGTEMI